VPCFLQVTQDMMSSKVESLRFGNSRIIEHHHTVVLGYSEAPLEAAVPRL